MHIDIHIPVERIKKLFEFWFKKGLKVFKENRPPTDFRHLLEGKEVNRLPEQLTFFETEATCANNRMDMSVEVYFLAKGMQSRTNSRHDSSFFKPTQNYLR